MKHKTILILGISALIFAACGSTPENAKTSTVKVWGNCGMCKKTIEGALQSKDIAKADWNKDTKVLTVTYDSTKTNLDVIQKQVAAAGYDNEAYKADDKAYANLHECCKYERKP